jgi:hypothetical protein
LIDEGQRDSLAALQDSERFPLEIASLALRTFYQRSPDDPRRAQIQLFDILGVSKNIDREYQNAVRFLADMVRLFLCKVFPHIHAEILNRSMIPTGPGSPMSGSSVVL